MLVEKRANKFRWAEIQEDDDNEDLDFMLPPPHVVGPDENGNKKTTEYYFDENRNIVKRTTTTQASKFTTALGRRSWSKFGDAVHDVVGPGLTMVSGDEIFLERAGGYVQEEAKTQLGKPGGVIKACRTCKGDHWTAKCPYKDLEPQTDDHFVETGGSAYVPPNMRVPGGGSRRDQKYSVRVTNLSEDTREPDLLDLFSTCGNVIRTHIVTDYTTGISRGFGFVDFVMKEDAERAIAKLDGYGYDNLILRVEFAIPRPANN